MNAGQNRETRFNDFSEMMIFHRNLPLRCSLSHVQVGECGGGYVGRF